MGDGSGEQATTEESENDDGSGEDTTEEHEDHHESGEQATTEKTENHGGSGEDTTEEHEDHDGSGEEATTEVSENYDGSRVDVTEEPEDHDGSGEQASTAETENHDGSGEDTTEDPEDLDGSGEQAEETENHDRSGEETTEEPEDHNESGEGVTTEEPEDGGSVGVDGSEKNTELDILGHDYSIQIPHHLKHPSDKSELIRAISAGAAKNKEKKKVILAIGKTGNDYYDNAYSVEYDENYEEGFQNNRDYGPNAYSQENYIQANTVYGIGGVFFNPYVDKSADDKKRIPLMWEIGVTGATDDNFGFESTSDQGYYNYNYRY